MNPERSSRTKKSITSRKSLKTLDLVLLIPLNRFALSQREELILSHLTLRYGTINKSKYLSFVEHYPPLGNATLPTSTSVTKPSAAQHPSSPKFSP